MHGQGVLGELQRNKTSKSKKSKDKDEKSRSKSKSKSKKHKRDQHPGVTPGADPAGPSEKPSSLEQPQGAKSVKISDNTINPISSQRQDQTYVSGLTDSDERPSNDDQTKSHSGDNKQFSGG
jgi:hypothetical protein